MVLRVQPWACLVSLYNWLLDTLLLAAACMLLFALCTTGSMQHSYSLILC
jgi:hypothetical protein